MTTPPSSTRMSSSATQVDDLPWRVNEAVTMHRLQEPRRRLRHRPAGRPQRRHEDHRWHRHTHAPRRDAGDPREPRARGDLRRSDSGAGAVPGWTRRDRRLRVNGQRQTGCTFLFLPTLGSPLVDMTTEPPVVRWD
jgi:hypothetical protein